MIPEQLIYTKEHEWLDISDDGTALMGITEHAQDKLGDIVYAELPAVGDMFTKAQVFGSVESVKAVSELYMPLDAEVLAINDALEDTPEVINTSPYKEGWMIRIKLNSADDVGKLMSAEAYAAYIEGLS